MNKEQFMAALSAYGRDNLLTDTAKHWSNDNAMFERTMPTFGDRFVRGLNPMTSFGSAMGAMHDAAGQGDKTDMAIAALQALPLFGALGAVAVPGKGLIKNGIRMLPSIKKTAAIGGVGAVGSGTVDQVQANNEQRR